MKINPFLFSFPKCVEHFREFLLLKPEKVMTGSPGQRSIFFTQRLSFPLCEDCRVPETSHEVILETGLRVSE